MGGFADPRNGLWKMTCCGMLVPYQEPKPGGRWYGNHGFEVEKCPNPGCPTNRRTEGK